MPWAWQEDGDGFRSKIHTKGAGKGRRVEKGDSSGKGIGKGGGRRPEWRCSCGTHNFLDRNWCRLCGKDYTNGELVKPPETTGAAASVPSQEAAGPVETPKIAAAGGAPASVTQQIRMHKALLAAARQSGDTPEAHAEAKRHEGALARLAAEEKAALPPENRLRSALDRVRGRERVAAAADSAVADLTVRLDVAKKAAADAHSALEKDRCELQQLQAISKGMCQMQSLASGGLIMQPEININNEGGPTPYKQLASWT